MIDTKIYDLDIVFASFGKEVYSNEYANTIREQNLSMTTEKIWNWIPQAGFQEKVLCNDADILIIGGRRGGGKSLSMLLAPLRNISNPHFLCVGFRKEEADIQRGLWAASKPVYMSVGESRETDFSWKFSSGATIRFEHLQNEQEVDRRFRGVEVPFMIIDELTQISFKTFFTLLASNRNTVGIRNQFIGSCNPVDNTHWLYKFLSWYIDEETGIIRSDRNGKKRYFFKYGDTINEVMWGDSKEEVYKKAKQYIDSIWDEANEESGLTKYDLINSLCFIEGEYSQNKIFIKRDPTYLGNLAQQGGVQSYKDIKGLWGIGEGGNCEISADDFQRLFTNTAQGTGKIYAIADVALTRDEFLIGAFDGNHLFDIECFVNVGSETAVTLVRKFLNKHHIREENFAFDSDGIGNYLKEPFHAGLGGSIPFNNNSASSDNKIWYNLKAECAERFILAIREGNISIEPELQRRIMPDGKTFREHLEEQRRVLVRKVNSTGKYQLISKPEMKVLLGSKRSPDEIDMMLMQQIFKINNKTGEFKGIGLLRFL
jgi:hypothetical protein